MTMRRDDCLAVLAEHCPDDIVVAIYSAAFDWVGIRPHPLNYFSVGAMGLGSSHGLGLALGQPDRRVIVVDGDGSLLMNKSSLVTIASVAPSNYYHFVCENGTYEANGAHPIPGRGTVSFSDIALAAGYPGAYTFSDLDDFRRGLADILAAPGPTFITLKVVPGEPVEPDYQSLYAASGRAAFKAALSGA